MGETSGFETRTYSVSQLLTAVREGKVRVPLFQRGFIWHDEDRRLLFDSIQRGYPIGTLLLAQGEAPASTVSLGEFRADAPAASDALWVVDGQQRLSTLAMSLLGEHTGALRPIYFDLDDNRFVLESRRNPPSPHWVPTSVLGSSKTLNRWLRDANLPDDLNDRADAVAGRIRDYVVPAYVVPYGGASDVVPQEVFARINRRGRALKRHEVFDALHVSAAGVKPLQRVDLELTQLGFGPLGEPLIGRAAMAIAGRAPGPLPENLVERDQVGRLFDSVAASLGLAIELLVREAGVPHVDLLPYTGVLTTLGRFFAQHPRPHARNLELLGRWFWRGTLTGDFTNPFEARQWAAIDGDEHASVQRLLRLLPPVTKALCDRPLAPYRHGQARTNIELLAMCDLEPRVLAGEEQGDEVAIASLLTEDGSQNNFPALIHKGGAAPERTVTHYLLHPKITVEALRSSSPQAAQLSSHAIDARAWDALMRGKMKEFLARRAEVLEAHLRAFLTERTAWEAIDRDRPPLDSYFLEESA